MNDRLYDIMGDLGDAIEDLESIIDLIKLEIEAMETKKGLDISRSVLRVHLQFINGIYRDCKVVHERIDLTILDIIHHRI